MCLLQTITDICYTGDYTDIIATLLTAIELGVVLGLLFAVLRLFLRKR